MSEKAQSIPLETFEALTGLRVRIRDEEWLDISQGRRFFFHLLSNSIEVRIEENRYIIPIGKEPIDAFRLEKSQALQRLQELYTGLHAAGKGLWDRGLLLGRSKNISLWRYLFGGMPTPFPYEWFQSLKIAVHIQYDSAAYPYLEGIPLLILPLHWNEAELWTLDFELIYYLSKHELLSSPKYKHQADMIETLCQRWERMITQLAIKDGFDIPPNGRQASEKEVQEVPEQPNPISFTEVTKAW